MSVHVLFHFLDIMIHPLEMTRDVVIKSKIKMSIDDVMKG